MEELIALIMSTGSKTVVEWEPVIEGLFRPLIIHYVAPEGTVEEKFNYIKDSAMTKGFSGMDDVPTIRLMNID